MESSASYVLSVLRNSLCTYTGREQFVEEDSSSLVRRVSALHLIRPDGVWEYIQLELRSG